MSTPRKRPKAKAAPRPRREDAVVEVTAEEAASVVEALTELAYAVREDFPDRPQQIGYYLRKARNEAYKNNGIPCDDAVPDHTALERIEASFEAFKAIDALVGYEPDGADWPLAFTGHDHLVMVLVDRTIRELERKWK